MKLHSYFLTGILFILVSFVPEQNDFVTSHISVMKETGESMISSDNSYAVIKLNTYNQQLDINSCVLLTISDSITKKDELFSLSLNFTGQFPIDNLDFYDVANDKNIHTANGILTVNNVPHSYRLNFGLHGPNSINFRSQDASSYQAQINFAMEIGSVDYGLNDIPANVTKAILVVIKDGIINKTNENNVGPECVGQQ
jgi:hypothetical protein